MAHMARRSLADTAAAVVEMRVWERVTESVWATRRLPAQVERRGEEDWGFSSAEFPGQADVERVELLFENGAIFYTWTCDPRSVSPGDRLRLDLRILDLTYLEDRA